MTTRERGREKDGREPPDVPLDDLTGKATVNNGPEPENEPSGREDGESAEPPAAPVVDLSTDLSEALDGDELALRRLLHGAVGDLRPSDGALEHLHKAVPVRRARKRQAVVGVAAAALLLGTAVPAFMHVANTGTTTHDRAVSAGHDQTPQGGAASGKGDGGPHENADSPSDKVSADEDEPGKKGKPGTDASNAADGGKGGSNKDSARSDAVTATGTCTAARLGAAGAEVGGPDGTGTVYGTFRVTNISSSSCTVGGRGSVGVGALGAADATRVGQAAHTSGDAASGLPDPSQEVAALSLPPNGSYAVKFAWVPADTCPTGSASPDPSPSGDTSAGAGGTAGSENGGGENGGSDTQLLTEGTADGSVSVTYTAEPGSPSVSATIPNACAGTVYWTGILAGS
ncbi:hypothetical protein AB0O07_26275 [Streptomyces sp. NPDC093085]|uniref:hypothetical protein n=1 Tax=Streptomyces sp. NPDC093085 TaxID=3155068 RepID=UPI003423089E